MRLVFSGVLVALAAPGAASAQQQDTTPPDTSITSGPQVNPGGRGGQVGATQSRTASFFFTSTEAGSTFECKVDLGSTPGAYAPCTSPRSFTALPDGRHIFWVRAKDAAGNVDPSPATFIWQVDNSEPFGGMVNKPRPLENVNGYMFAFGPISHVEDGGHFQCKLDAGDWAVCHPANAYGIGGLSDGPHTFSVRAVDLAGNIDSTPDTVTWVVDTIPPETTITSGPSGVTNSTAARFEFTQADAHPSSRFECKLDAGEWAACNSPKEFTALL